jgi:hypothetical protein
MCRAQVKAVKMLFGNTGSLAELTLKWTSLDFALVHLVGNVTGKKSGHKLR